MTDIWGWYKAAIKAKNEGKPLPAIEEGNPQAGFYYRRASKQGGRIPVCIYPDGDGKIVARLGVRADHRVVPASDEWTWCAENVTPRDDYVFAWEQGKWADGTPTKAPALPHGSNLPVDPFERLKAEVDDKMESATAWLKAHPKVESQVDCDYAANLNRELLALHKQADKLHETEKEPHLAAGRAVDEKFRFRAQVKASADSLKRAFEAYMVAEDRRRRAEAEKKHQEEMAKVQAERDRIAAERAKKLADDPVAAMTDPEPELPMEPPKPVVKVQAGGGVGSARGLKTVWEPRIDDWKAAAAQFVAQDDPDIRAAVEKKIKALARLNKEATKIDGVTMVQDRRAA